MTGAASDDEAHRAARKVADSLLVKCSLNGEDPYWGRVVSELGSAGVAFDLDRVEVAYGGVVVCRAGVAADHDDRGRARAHAGPAPSSCRCDLGLGAGSGAVLTHRPRPRLHRREQDDVVSAELGPSERGRGPGRGPALHPALLGQGRRRQVRRQRACARRRGSERRRASGPATAEALASFAEDVVLMRSVGMLPVVVHGGGPADRRAHGAARQGARVPSTGCG